MCGVVKLLLLLLLLAVGSNAAPTAQDCEGLTRLLPARDLHQVLGDWVLVWSVADHQEAWDLLPNVSSSHVELRLLPPDNKTLVFKERNVYRGNSCAIYTINMTMPSDPSETEHYPLAADSIIEDKDGVVQPYNDTGVIDVYESCPDCLVIVYKSNNGRFLLIYRREGQHSDTEQLKAAHDGFRKQAECLGLPHDKPFIYDGVADFCHRKKAERQDS